MTRRHEIWLGDLARALDALRPTTPEGCAAVAASLGFELVARPKEDPVGESPFTPLPPSPPNRVSTPAVVPPPPPPRAATSRAGSRVTRTRLDPTPRPPVPDWLAALQGIVTVPHSGTPLAPEPLIPPRYARGVLGAALATARDDGPIDLDRVIAELARGTAVTRLPRLPRFGVGTETWLLLDHSEAMAPFRSDVAGLQRSVQALLGRDRVRVRRFIGTPARGVWPSARGSRPGPWPGSQGISVLLVSPLGIGPTPRPEERATAEEWVQFGASLTRMGAWAVALVPQPRERWPAGIPGIVPVRWDPASTARAVAQRVKRAARR